MIKWFKKKNEDSTSQAPCPPPETIEKPDDLVQEQDEVSSRSHFLGRFRSGLLKTREKLGEGVLRFLLGKKTVDAAVMESLEARLIQADLGVALTQDIFRQIETFLSRRALADGAQVYEALESILRDTVRPLQKPLDDVMSGAGPFVILVVGVNGTGKTTTIAKLADRYQKQGKKVMLAAGDTFRAAAVEQLQVWGARANIPVIAQHTGADSASVIFDALTAAKARDMDVLIADTAGRLHTQMNLMDELKKIKRVLQKIDPDAPHETMLVLDASIGQNALAQAQEFHQAIGVTGITMTKLDGTARGGMLFALANALHIPFRFLGFGEKAEDLRPFDADCFVEAIFHHDSV